MGEIGGDFEKLPEACVSHVLSLTTPRDSCRSAAVSSAFRSAIDSDIVWERFLPSDYKEILDRAVAIVPWSSKRELYFRLCDPILIDGGKMSFNLEKATGAKCYMISCKELAFVGEHGRIEILDQNIIEIFNLEDAPQCWKWVPVADLGSFDARFPEVARLLKVCWLEIRGKIETRMLSPNTNYAAYLVFRLDKASSRGFDLPVQEASVKIGSSRESKQYKVCLNPWFYMEILEAFNKGAWIRIYRPFARGMPIPDVLGLFEGSRFPSTRIDGWLEIEMGDFFCGGDDDDVEFCLMEVKGGHRKSGLIVLGIELRPKY